MDVDEAQNIAQLPHDAPANQPQSTLPTSSSSSKTKNKKRKTQHNPNPPIQTSMTLRKPRWSYIHLQHINSSTAAPPELDAVTANLHLTTALTQFLGLHGAAMANGVDILKLSRSDAWIRVAHDDRSALIAAVGGWVGASGEGWRVRGWSSWDAGARGKGRDGGQDLFDD